jgi:hypothetical protein
MTKRPKGLRPNPIPAQQGRSLPPLPPPPPPRLSLPGAMMSTSLPGADNAREFPREWAQFGNTPAGDERSMRGLLKFIRSVVGGASQVLHEFSRAIAAADAEIAKPFANPGAGFTTPVVPRMLADDRDPNQLFAAALSRGEDVLTQKAHNKIRTAIPQGLMQLAARINGMELQARREVEALRVANAARYNAGEAAHPGYSPELHAAYISHTRWVSLADLIRDLASASGNRALATAAAIELIPGERGVPPDGKRIRRLIEAIKISDLGATNVQMRTGDGRVLYVLCPTCMQEVFALGVPTPVQARLLQFAISTRQQLEATVTLLAVTCRNACFIGYTLAEHEAWANNELAKLEAEETEVSRSIHDKLARAQQLFSAGESPAVSPTTPNTNTSTIQPQGAIE